MQCRVSGQFLQRRLKLRGRRVKVCFLEVCDTQIGLKAGVLRAQAKSSLKLPDGRVCVSELQASETEIVVGFCVLRLLLHDALKGCDGVVYVARALQQD